MGGQQFTFPPPPPAPPAAAQNYPAYNQPGAGQNRYGGWVNRGDRGNRGYGRGNNKGGPRGGGHFGSNSGYGGYLLAGTEPAIPPNAGYNAQANDQRRGGYPLPSYPPVQLPQYPANLGQEYGQRRSTFAPSTTYPQPPQAMYPPNFQGSTQQPNGQNQYGSHNFGSLAPNTQPTPYPPQNPEPFQPRQGAGHSQPVFMGPPLRMGFDKERGDLRVQQYPQPSVSNAANPYQNGTYKGSGSPYRHNSPMSNHPTHHESPNPFSGHRGQGQKRRHGDAFSKLRNHNPRPQAAPAVPSFGAPLPLPVKPPVPQDGPRKPRKKKRKHNQLGLTPKREEHESSEEDEDDADEEARLAAAVAGGPQLLQFEYRGQISTLQSSSDIAAWIEERKKRFPTKARAAEIAEKKRQRQEGQQAAFLARKEAQEKQRAEKEKIQKKKREEEQIRKQKKFKDDSEDAAGKAKRKVEKLRRQLEKEERRAAKAEAKAEAKASKDKLQDDANGCGGTASNDSQKRKRSDSDISHNKKSGEAKITKPGQPLHTNTTNGTAIQAEPFFDSKQKANETAIHNFALATLQEKEEAVASIPDPLTPTSQPAAPDDHSDPPPSILELDSAPPATSLSNGLSQVNGDASLIASIDKASQSSSISMSDSSSDLSATDSEDITSSSGSSSSDADSDDDAPDKTSSRRNGPERVPPPRREKPKQICRDFLKNGRCKRGDDCRFRHELPERGSRDTRIMEVPKVEKRTERIGLHQRLVEQEKEKEDQEILKAIIHLGENGLLEQGIPSEGPEM